MSLSALLAGYQIIDRPGGRREHYLDGLLHRRTGPAVIDPSGRQEWWVEGKLHREGGPAVTDPAKGAEHWQEGVLHRTDGPAVERPDGYSAWYRYGVLHRGPLDGPALTLPDGSVHFYEDGVFLRSEPETPRPGGAERARLVERALSLVAILEDIPVAEVGPAHLERVRELAWRELRLELPMGAEIAAELAARGQA